MGAKARITMANVTPGTRTHRGCKISELAALTTTTHEQHEKIRRTVSLAAHGLDLSGERDTSCALLVRREQGFSRILCVVCLFFSRVNWLNLSCPSSVTLPFLTLVHRCNPRLRPPGRHFSLSPLFSAHDVLFPPMVHIASSSSIFICPSSLFCSCSRPVTSFLSNLPPSFLSRPVSRPSFRFPPAAPLEWVPRTCFRLCTSLHSLLSRAIFLTTLTPHQIQVKLYPPLGNESQVSPDSPLSTEQHRTDSEAGI